MNIRTASGSRIPGFSPWDLQISLPFEFWRDVSECLEDTRKKTLSTIILLSWFLLAHLYHQIACVAFHTFLLNCQPLITKLFTDPKSLSHVEETLVKFATGTTNQAINGELMVCDKYWKNRNRTHAPRQGAHSLEEIIQINGLKLG